MRVLLAWRAIERKSDCEGSWNILGRAYFASGRHEEAAALVERAIEANGDDYNTYVPYTNALKAGSEEGSRESPRADVQGLAPTTRAGAGRRPRPHPAGVNAGLLEQDADETIRHLQTAVALRPGDANILYNAACAYGVLGKKAEALETIKKAFAVGYGNPNWAAKDSDLDCLHDDPEFRKLVGLPEHPQAS